MWIKCTTVQNVVIHGEMKHFQPGDWINVGKALANDWIAGGTAIAVDMELLKGGAVESTSGIAVRGALADGWRDRLAQIEDLKVAFYEDGWTPELPFTETLIWQPSFDLRLDLLLTGFKMLKVWQVVIPLWDYTTLAANIGTTAEREQTQAVIRDLRVPLRDTRLIYVRRCEDTRRLMEVWAETMTNCHEERLAFMQALYTVKPLVCDLPASWTGNRT